MCCKNLSDLPPHCRYETTNLNPLFYSNMLKPVCILFLAPEATILPIYSITYQYQLKPMKFFASTKQKSPKLKQPLPLNSFVLHPKIEVVQFWDKLKRFLNAPFKIKNKPTEVMYALPKQDGK